MLLSSTYSNQQMHENRYRKFLRKIRENFCESENCFSINFFQVKAQTRKFHDSVKDQRRENFIYVVAYSNDVKFSRNEPIARISAFRADARGGENRYRIVENPWEKKNPKDRDAFFGATLFEVAGRSLSRFRDSGVALLKEREFHLRRRSWLIRAV